VFKTIVWATDGSEFADSTLPLITGLAGVHGSRIVAVHVNELLRGRFGGAPVLADEDELRHKIVSQVTDLQAAGFDAELEVRTTHRVDTSSLIAESAAAAGADLIVIGTRGLSEIGALLHGTSVAKGLTHVAPCPVLVIPPADAVVLPASERELVGAAV
jgi:nucleotide-binding universal stress UspA family protein